MLVSIITPAYNSDRFIATTIESVLKQTHTNWEHLIIDDCSIDGTYEVVKRYTEGDSRIKYIKLEKNSGVAVARNEGVKRASGSFIAFLDSDDLWDPSKLEKQLKFMITNDFVFSHTAYRKINTKGEVFYDKIGVSTEVDYSKLLKHNEIGCLTAMYNVDKLGKYYFPLIDFEDFATWLKILKDGNKSYGLNEALASYRVHSNTLSSNKFKAASYTWHIFRSEEGFSIFKSLYFYSFYMVNSVMKYLKGRVV